MIGFPSWFCMILNDAITGITCNPVRFLCCCVVFSNGFLTKKCQAHARPIWTVYAVRALDQFRYITPQAQPAECLARRDHIRSMATIPTFISVILPQSFKPHLIVFNAVFSGSRSWDPHPTDGVSLLLLFFCSSLSLSLYLCLWFSKSSRFGNCFSSR